ncbi:MAG: hypothetical protein FGM55_15365 [Rhodoferax sp.]|nr:hypothetical protein [Rhodoferax sp.]
MDIDNPDASIPPRIQPLYLDHDDDVQTALRGARLIRQLESTPAFRDLIVRPVEPSLATLDDDGMVSDFRSRASTCYHPVGTCMMGRDANTSVVGPDLKVHGVDALYVIDASVFPNVTSGNTHAPTTMVAHRGAKAVLRALQN